MLEEITQVPGKIWCFLEKNGESTVYKMKKELGLSDSLVYIGIGWLAKEDKLIIRRDAGSIKISVK